MVPVETPSANCYVAPKDYAAEKMHYGVVQVSRYRYVVVQYAGSTMAMHGSLPSFVTVSEPMRFDAASDLAQELLNARLNFNLLPITAEDRTKFPHMEDSAVLSHKIVHSIGDFTLLVIRTEIEERREDKPDSKFRELLLRVGPKTNPNWLQNRVAEVLYGRNLICGAEFDQLVQR